MDPQQKPQQTETAQTQRHQHALARRIAPEDVLPGMYVTIMTMVFERWASPFCQDATAWKSPPVQFESVPPFSGLPLRVAGVCLPFVLVQRPDGGHWTADTRRHKLAVLSDRFGAESFRRMACDAARDRTGPNVTDGDEDDED